ncbi:NAD-dependent epimerase/dehydratase family protein [Phycisphaera mikurensis]|nr:NAD(P)-dependent oxidoreductase [Phycisphaera mikurensis]MBB6443317.1 hypothetical protein [Phycisphaera mikurensis]
MHLTGLKTGSRVVVTGAMGWVGSRTLGRLATEHEVKGLDLEPGAAGGCVVDEIDLIEYEAVREALEGAEGVVHLAIASRRALTHLDEHDYAAVEIQSNVLGTRNVFEAAAEAGVKRMVYFSSLTIQLGEPQRRWIGPGAPLRPSNPYAVTKLYGEQLAWLYANQGRLSTVAWRLGQPYPVEHFSLEHMRDPEERACGITAGDIARGMLAGLSADLSVFEAPEREAGPAEELPCGGRPGFTPGFAVANLVSASDTGDGHGYDLSVARRLGYEPAECFTAEGPVPVQSLRKAIR